jgi:hypothetical protein
MKKIFSLILLLISFASMAQFVPRTKQYYDFRKGKYFADSLYADLPIVSLDTTNYKPVVYGPNKKIFRTYWQAPGGGSSLSGLTSGRVNFSTSSTTIGDDGNLLWDNTNKMLTVNSTNSNQWAGYNKNLVLSGAAPSFDLWSTTYLKGWTIAMDESVSPAELVIAHKSDATTSDNQPLKLLSNGSIKVNYGFSTNNNYTAFSQTFSSATSIMGWSIRPDRTQPGLLFYNDGSNKGGWAAGALDGGFYIHTGIVAGDISSGVVPENTKIRWYIDSIGNEYNTGLSGTGNRLMAVDANGKKYRTTLDPASIGGGGSISSTTSVLKGNGSGSAVAATAGTDYVTPGGTETLTNKTFTAPTLDEKVRFTGSAPSTSGTGNGTGGSAGITLEAGSNSNVGTINIDTGTSGMASTGTVTLTLSGSFSGNKPVYVATLIDDTGTWGNTSQVKITTSSNSAPVLTWTNSSSGTTSALGASLRFKISYVMFGK